MTTTARKLYGAFGEGRHPRRVFRPFLTRIAMDVDHGGWYTIPTAEISIAPCGHTSDRSGSHVCYDCPATPTRR